MLTSSSVSFKTEQKELFATDQFAQALTRLRDLVIQDTYYSYREQLDKDVQLVQSHFHPPIVAPTDQPESEATTTTVVAEDGDTSAIATSS